MDEAALLNHCAAIADRVTQVVVCAVVVDPRSVFPRRTSQIHLEFYGTPLQPMKP